jgi:hypothetical protein
LGVIMSSILILNKFEKAPEGYTVIDTTSNSGAYSGLSPFIIGPCKLYNGHIAENMENGWQFAKVYKHHTDDLGNPTQAYWDWAKKGWEDKWAHRYPMGKGAIPEYSLWQNEKLGYIEARKRIYGPLYAHAVVRTTSFDRVFQMHTVCNIALRDYDGYNHDKLNMTLTDVLNNPKKKMGHAFVLKALLTGDPVLKEYGLV